MSICREHWTKLREAIESRGLGHLIAADGALAAQRTADQGKTWPRCAVCYLGLAHELTCRDRKCKLPKKGGYDWMIGKAADEEVKHAVKLGVHDATGG